MPKVSGLVCSSQHRHPRVHGLGGRRWSGRLCLRGGGAGRAGGSAPSPPARGCRCPWRGASQLALQADDMQPPASHQLGGISVILLLQLPDLLPVLVLFDQALSTGSALHSGSGRPAREAEDKVVGFFPTRPPIPSKIDPGRLPSQPTCQPQRLRPSPESDAWAFPLLPSSARVTAFCEFTQLCLMLG